MAYVRKHKQKSVHSHYTDKQTRISGNKVLKHDEHYTRCEQV